ncbi:MAG TPA: ubiquitin [Candidatus Galloscillospira excrementavium]|nr:ubiquitin [Candidatus Galloscillospira excrementavium]
MSVTFEQVEKLREKSGASYTDCAEALEHTGGDLLEAILYLERTGRSASVPGGGFYSTRPGASPPPSGGDLAVSHAAAGGGGGSAGSAGRGQAAGSADDWRVSFRAAAEAFLNLFRHASDNRLEIWRKGEQMTSLPVAVVIILAVVAFWITLPLLIIGLFLGCRYRFSGPELGRESVNEVMDGVGATVDDMVDRVKDEVRKHTESKKNQKKN